MVSRANNGTMAMASSARASLGATSPSSTAHSWPPGPMRRVPARPGASSQISPERSGTDSSGIWFISRRRPGASGSTASSTCSRGRDTPNSSAISLCRSDKEVSICARCSIRVRPRRTCITDRPRRSSIASRIAASSAAARRWRLRCRNQPAAPTAADKAKNTSMGKPGISPNVAMITAATISTRGSAPIWAMMSVPRLVSPSAPTRVTTRPAVSEISSAGIWAIRPSPIARSE